MNPAFTSEENRRLRELAIDTGSYIEMTMSAYLIWLPIVEAMQKRIDELEKKIDARG